ncbi:Carbon monoxide dehydrogenase subunit G [Burkholderia sp. YR290]|jgi:carbon monoxide dehydrogenase subunit G|uniref:SRPBCC family protein n=1 Tax=Paraburkholderia hospita TaxID=169430 RepID=UPI000271687F|nr:SRPBCC family protein [Paraburkholderia hospita]EUC14026.1 carbon monoxide dehydrogenase subunit G [Burkholderia sp. BT03]SKC91419.1 Carbon monoxide dehydrogenase subunit G [Paraburkholderia hospita]SOE69214.1 Carbon monoxide dehydrogenase subunit G [Burkholderia sp. YR290]
MEIEQSFTVPYPLDDVWARFHDTPGIVACLPGASLTAPVDNGMLKLAMTVKLGPIVASFAGDGEMKLDDAQYCGSITGTGVDRKSASRVKGVASFALEEAAGETRVDVKVDYTIGGSLAQFSRSGIVKELATRMTEAFAANLKAKLDEAGTAAGSAVAQADATPVAQAATATEPSGPEAEAPAQAPRVESRPAARVQPVNAPLDVGNLFWKMLWSRLRGIFSFASR